MLEPINQSVANASFINKSFAIVNILSRNIIIA